jgi:hypothetical protein
MLGRISSLTHARQFPIDDEDAEDPGHDDPPVPVTIRRTLGPSRSPTTGSRWVRLGAANSGREERLIWCQRANGFRGQRPDSRLRCGYDRHTRCRSGSCLNSAPHALSTSTSTTQRSGTPGSPWMKRPRWSYGIGSKGSYWVPKILSAPQAPIDSVSVES